jgi:hypothetical protein
MVHHVQFGDIDNTKGYKQVPIDVKVSETGVSLDDAKMIAGALGSSAGQENLKILGYFQMGPRTGNPVYVKNYTHSIATSVEDQCKSGRVTGLQSIRETRKYPVISGEIVRVTGYCMVKR